MRLMARVEQHNKLKLANDKFFFSDSTCDSKTVKLLLEFVVGQFIHISFKSHMFQLSIILGHAPLIKYLL